MGTTGNDGKVTFKITTSQPEHGPSLDLRPAFLPANERYHVNVLIDNQKLEKPAPPRLEAQATDPGLPLEHRRQRWTTRAIVHVARRDHRSRCRWPTTFG